MDTCIYTNVLSYYYLKTYMCISFVGQQKNKGCENYEIKDLVDFIKNFFLSNIIYK